MQYKFRFKSYIRQAGFVGPKVPLRSAEVVQAQAEKQKQTSNKNEKAKESRTKTEKISIPPLLWGGNSS